MYIAIFSATYYSQNLLKNVNKKNHIFLVQFSAIANFLEKPYNFKKVLHIIIQLKKYLCQSHCQDANTEVSSGLLNT